jgi:hypothetical protein
MKTFNKSYNETLRITELLTATGYMNELKADCKYEHHFANQVKLARKQKVVNDLLRK